MTMQQAPDALEESAQESNWAGNYNYRATVIHHPESEADVQALVRGASSVQALGSRHSFNSIADSTGIQICLDKMAVAVSIDEAAMTVTVGGGSSYGALAVELAAHGFGLTNLASLPHISVAGAIATATHGSGDDNANLAADVVALRLVDGTGEIHSVSRAETEDFAGYVVGLGALGIVTEVTLSIVPAYRVAQHIYLGLDWEAVLADYDAVTSRAYSVSLFTDWSGETVGQVWFKQKIGDGRTSDYPAELLGGTRRLWGCTRYRASQPCTVRSSWEWLDRGKTASRISEWSSCPAPARKSRVNTSSIGPMPFRRSKLYAPSVT